MAERLILKEYNLFKKTKNNHRPVIIAVLGEGKSYIKIS